MNINRRQHSYCNEIKPIPTLSMMPKRAKSEREISFVKKKEMTNKELAEKIFNIIRCVRDLDHPYTIQLLDVIDPKDIKIRDIKKRKFVTVYWTPYGMNHSTIARMGLAFLMKLEKELPDFKRMKFEIKIKDDHIKSKDAINKQLNDKERVAAARENKPLVSLIESIIS